MNPRSSAPGAFAGGQGVGGSNPLAPTGKAGEEAGRYPGFLPRLGAWLGKLWRWGWPKFPPPTPGTTFVFLNGPRGVWEIIRPYPGGGLCVAGNPADPRLHFLEQSRWNPGDVLVLKQGGAP